MSKLHELWTELRNGFESAPTDGLSLRLLYSERDVRLFAAVTNPGSKSALVIELPFAHRPKDLARISSRTFEAVLANFSGLPSGKCAISVVLLQNEFADLFAVLGEELVHALQRSVSTPAACHAVVSCIDRWRRFVEKNRRSLSDEAVRGLIGELIVLGRVAQKFGALPCVHAWQGPTGSLKDFELPDFTVEVKTYQTDTGAAVRINDPQQLEGSPGRPAYLSVVRLTRVQAAGRTLAEFVQLAEDALASDAEAVGAFLDRLAGLGYLRSQADQYLDRFLASPPLLFQVTDDFPRIRPDSVHTGIRDVHFSVLLASLSPFEVNAMDLVGPPGSLETV